MGMEDAIGQILTAKDQKPMLFEIGPLEYDFHDIDGLYYMLDRKLSGCLMLMWSIWQSWGICGCLGSRFAAESPNMERAISSILKAMQTQTAM